MMGNDLDFNFNPTPFTNAIQKIAQSLNFVEDKFKSAAGKMNLFTKKTVDDSKKKAEVIKDTSVNFGKQMGSALTGLIGKMGALGAAYLGAKALMSRMPEVGQAFSIAGDILMKNFVWPLRQELMPHLQKLLNWARDNRTTMLQWGQVLVNIFRAIVQVAKTIIDGLKPIFDVFKKIIKDIFGSTVKSLSDVMNILLFRLTVITLFIVTLFKPVIKALSNVIYWISQVARAFAGGFMSAYDSSLGTWTEVISSLINSFVKLVDAIFGVGEESDKSFTKSRKAGELLGGAIKMIVLAVRDLIDMLTALINLDWSKSPQWLQKLAGQSKEQRTIFFEEIKNSPEEKQRKAEIGKREKQWEMRRMEKDPFYIPKNLPTEKEKINPIINLKGIKTGSNTDIKNNFNFGEIKILANSESEGRSGAKGFMDEVNKSLFNALKHDINKYQVTHGT